MVNLDLILQLGQSAVYPTIQLLTLELLCVVYGFINLISSSCWRTDGDFYFLEYSVLYRCFSNFKYYLLKVLTYYLRVRLLAKVL